MGGTYFIELRGHQSENSHISIPYNIVYTAKKTSDEPNFNINDAAYNKDLKAALWVSDYVPMYLSTLNTNSSQTLYKFNGLNSNHPDYTKDALENLSGGNSIHLSSLYLFDNETKELVYQAYNYLYEQFKKSTIENLKDVDISVSLDTASNIINIAGKIYWISGGFANVGVNLAFKGSLFIADQIVTFLNSSIKKFTVDDYLYLDYITKITEALWSTRNTNDIVEIPVYYFIQNENDKVTLDFSASYNDPIHISSNYDFGVINPNSNNSYYTRGKVYAYTKNQEATGESNYYRDLELVKNVPYKEVNCEPMYISSPVSWGDLKSGEYKFYSFKANSNGTYYFNCYGEFESYIEVFNCLPTRNTTTGRTLTNYTSEYVNDNNNKKEGRFKVYCQKDQTIYFRVSNVRKYDLSVTNGTNIFSVSNQSIHLHNYNKYSSISDTQHKITCSCGTYKIEQHAVSGSSSGVIRKCIYCGAEIRFGIVEFNLMDYYAINSNKPIEFILVDNQYYIIETMIINDVLYLSYEDYQDILKILNN